MGGKATPRPELLAAEHGNLLRCIRCGLCLPVCPTYQLTSHETESPRGRIAMARAFVEGHLELTADLVAHQQSCLLCEACTAICPTGVQMERIGVAFRADGARFYKASALRRVAFKPLHDLAHVRLIARLAQLYSSSGLRKLLRASRLLSLAGLARAEAFLPPIRGDFLAPSGQEWSPLGEVRQRVGLFVGCVMSTIFADVDRAAARVLAANGCSVVAVRRQACCGALHLHSGDLETARRLARENVDAFKNANVDAIVSTAAGCTAALKDYGHLLRGEAGAVDFAAKVKDVTEFLAAIDLAPPSTAIPLKVTYQDACHLVHAQGVRAEPRALLGKIPGLQLIEMGDSAVCCGSAGIYSLTHPAAADPLMERKIDNALATGADVVVSANPGCMLQLEAGLRSRGAGMQVKHIVELLDEAYRNA